jgi:hypothetical protein
MLSCGNFDNKEFSIAIFFALANPAQLHFRYIFLKVKADWQKKAQANYCLQTMPSKKVGTLFIITLHIFSHFVRTFDLHKLY